MSEFAKVFQIEPFGQVVVMRDSDDDAKPELRVYFEPPDLGVSSFAIGWPDTDDGWEHRDGAFQRIDEDHARKILESSPMVMGLFTQEEP